MKKLLVALLFGMSITLTACGSSEEAELNEVEEVLEVEEVEDIEVEEIEVEEVNIIGANEVMVNGQTLVIGMDITEDIINELGEAVEVMEAPSCHFDGNDTIYTYDDVTLYVYQDGEMNVLYIIEITADGVITNTGVTVGMSREEVVEVYNAEYDEYGTIIEYTFEDTTVAISFDDSGVVDYVEIF